MLHGPFALLQVSNTIFFYELMPSTATHSGSRCCITRTTVVVCMVKGSKPCTCQNFLLVSNGKEVFSILNILNKVGEACPKTWVFLLTQDK